MADTMKFFILYLFTEKCYEKYFNLNFFDADCFRVVLSKVLGLGIIAGSSLVKIPQVLKIWSHKSAEGINLFSVLLDLFAITCHMSYSFVNGFPFSAWGDTTFLAVQTAIIATFVLYYGGKPKEATVFSLCYPTICYILMGGFIPIQLLWSMQALNIPIIVLGKISQAYTNLTNKSTGQLSAVTCFMLFAGSLARIFTSIQETGDFMMILTYAVSSTANGIILAQVLYYWNKPVKTKHQYVDRQNNKLKTKSKKTE